MAGRPMADLEDIESAAELPAAKRYNKALAKAIGDIDDAFAYSIIEKLRMEGKTIIMIEHRLKELFRIADRVVVLNYGQKIAEGKAETVMESNEVKKAYLGVEA